MFRRLSLFLALFLTVAVPLSAQTLTGTTSTAALTASGTSLQVTSATGFVVGHLIAIEREFMTVMTVTGNVIRVGERGSNGTAAAAHPTASVVYVGLPSAFKGWSLATSQIVRSRNFNIDNGAGTTIDHTLFQHPEAVQLTSCRIFYEETTATVAAANARIGTALAGATVVAATAYTNAATAGVAATPMIILNGAIPAGAPIIVRHTGIVGPAVGEAFVQCDFNTR